MPETRHHTSQHKDENNVKKPRGLYIIKRAEKALLNERIRSVNKMINMLKMQIDTCMEQLKTCLEERVMEECKLFINNKRESRHNLLRLFFVQPLISHIFLL